MSQWFWSGRSERDAQVSPCLRVGSLGHELPKPPKDRAELVVSQRPDEDAAGLGSPRLRPHPQQGREVSAVTSDEDALLSGGERQDLRVSEALQVRSFGQRQHVVTIVAQRTSDASTRQVRIEKQAHSPLRVLVGDVDERVE